MAAAARATEPVLVAVGQLRSTAAIAENMVAIRGLAKKAAARGAAMLFLPEASCCMGVSARDPEVVEALGATQGELAAISADCGLWVSVGGHMAASGDLEHRLDNVHWLFDPEGALRGEYRKTHLFDAMTAAGTLQESSYTRPGDELVAVRGTPVGTLGMLTCYDARFPSVTERLRFEAGADVLAMPSAFTVPTGAAHWEMLVRCRAAETQCYVAASAQWGDHGGGRSTWGHAMLVDPWGTVVAQCPEGHATLAVAEIDPAVTARVRGAMPLAAHRRTDLPLRVVDA